MITASYDPADDKIRLYPSSRLDKETYDRVKAAGYGWAPKQECFYAVWSPYREDLATELAGEIGDEDTSLVDRAEARAERFENYSDRREADAHAAKSAVDRIADGIPLGQPILVGHHSERHARKDAERIENGMRRAVKMWETAQYWQQRAKGALMHAKYLERPDVRHRRIKTLEADRRKQQRTQDTATQHLKWWTSGELTMERALAITNRGDSYISRRFPLADYPRNPPASQYEGDMSLWSALEGGVITPEQARDIAVPSHTRTAQYAQRWIDHLNNRIAYEQAMLGEQGGLVADKFDIQVGGRVLRRGEWMVVTKINRQDGRISSVSVIGRFAGVLPVEEIQDYRAPSAEDAEKVKAVTKQPPLCNFRSEGCIEMTSAEWKDKSRYSDALAVRGFTQDGEYKWRGEKDAPIVYRHRSRYFLGDHRTGTKVVPVFLTDAKETHPLKAATERVSIPREFDASYHKPTASYEREAKQPNEFEVMAQNLKNGIAVQVVAAPQLFPTPRDLARRMVDEAGITAGMRVLEPSAGTGAIVREVFNAFTGADCGRVVVVEINPALAAGLREDRAKRLYANEQNYEVWNDDFLKCTPEDLGTFHAIVMNPPFANADDIRHIEHARQFLKPGGRLVAICANGPRQNDKLRPMVEDNGGEWHDLPAGTFKDSGTGVNTAMLVYTAPVAVEAL
jgi:phospholipid N-methyltransferase